jgi:UDP-N-acetylmuramate--alanine ligase
MNYHLVGIGGVGMSALAALLMKQGHAVSGTDRNLESPVISFLRKKGAKIYAEDHFDVNDGTEIIAYSTAIENDHPIIRSAIEKNIRIIHRAQALSEALSSKKIIAVVGTCGKSSVTALLGHILIDLGYEPLCVNGAEVSGWEGSVYFGSGDYAIVEVDESDKSLVAFNPYAVIVTNSSADHFSKEEMDEVFDAFIKDVKGPVVDGRNDSYMPGMFMRQNENLAVRMALALGCDEQSVKKALCSFKGVKRRLEKYSEKVFDDYAHNTEKIRAMIESLKLAGKKSVCVIWRPHGYGPLKKMLKDLALMFDEELSTSDKLLLLPVYDAGGTADRSINSADLAKILPKAKIELVASHDEAYLWCERNFERYDVFVTAGARDVMLPNLAERISKISK